MTELTAPAETSGLRAEADLCKAAGAPTGLIEQWIETGRHHRRSARATSHTGGNGHDSAGRPSREGRSEIVNVSCRCQATVRLSGQ